MKSSYNLLTIYIDGYCIPVRCPPVTVIEQRYYIPGYLEEYSLFDLEIYQRKISLSELLSTQTRNDADRIIRFFEECDYIWIEMDSFSISQTVNNFLIKRALQYISLMRSFYPDKEIGLMVPEALESYWNRTLKNYYALVQCSTE